MNKPLALALFALTAAACSNDVTGTSNDGAANGGSGVGPSTSATGSPNGPSSGSGGTGGKYEPPPDSQTLDFGPYDVPAYTERTQCIVKRLGNVGPLFVNRLHNELSTVSHHMIVYRVDDTEETTEPYDCQPFADTLSGGGGPMMITQKHSDSLELPPGVAFALDPNQMIRLEVHYINASGDTQPIEAHATFEAMDPADFHDAAGFVFAGTLDVDLPPNQVSQAHRFIDMPTELAGKSFFGFTGHVHKFGTNVRVERGNGSGPLEPVYDVPDFSWSEPPTVYHDPPVVLANGDGFDLSCDYENTSSSHVGFGESANDEMCFFWAYYYPDAGPKVIF